MLHRFRIAKDVASESEYFLNVGGLWSLKAWRLFDHIMKPEFEPRVLAIGPERLRLGMVRIENRQDVADLAAGVTSEFLNSTDRDQKWSVGFRHAAYLPIWMSQFLNFLYRFVRRKIVVRGKLINICSLFYRLRRP
jgi:hypothetical protein